MKTQRAAVTNRPPQNPTQHIIAIRVPGLNPIRNRKAQRPDMIRNHAEGDIQLRLFPGGTGHWPVARGDPPGAMGRRVDFSKRF